MKNKKAVAAIVVLVVLVAVAAVCWFAFGPKAVAGGKTITVDVTHKDGTMKTFEITTDAEFLRGALEQEKLVQGDETEYGLYILTVDGKTVYFSGDTSRTSQMETMAAMKLDWALLPIDGIYNMGP